MKQYERPDMTGTALLVIDVQQSFQTPGRWERRWNAEFETNVSRLIGLARAGGAEVIYFLHQDGDDGFHPDSPLYRLMPFLDRRPSDVLLHKSSRNCFTTTDLQRRLTLAGVSRLIICGIQTEQCCETTARVAADLGYSVDFVTEATQTFPIAGPDGNLPAHAVVERTEYALRDRFARIVTVDQLAAEATVLQLQ